MLRLKLVFEKDARRFAIKDEVTLEKVRGVVNNAFDVEHFTMKYLDDDNEEVTLSTPEDFDEALRLVEDMKSPVLKLMITRANAPVVDEKEPVSETPAVPTIQEIFYQLMQLVQNDDAVRAELPEAAKVAVQGYLDKSDYKTIVSQILDQCPGIRNHEIIASWNIIENWDAIFQGCNSDENPGFCGFGLPMKGMMEMAMKMGPMSGFGAFPGMPVPPMENPLNPFMFAEPYVEEDEAVHRGVRCDACHVAPIKGNRYKCAVCPDYDLCAECEGKNVHSEHDFVKFKKPARFGRMFGSDRVRCKRERRCRKGRGRRGRNNKEEEKAPVVNEVEPMIPVVSSKFIDDVNYFDGENVTNDTPLILKTWKVKNDGNVSWPEGTKLKFENGDRGLVYQDEYDVEIAPSGETVDVSAVIKVPRNVGRYRASFKLAGNDGKTFGHTFWIDFNRV